MRRSTIQNQSPSQRPRKSRASGGFSSWIVGVALAVGTQASANERSDFTTFESAHVRPLALSADQKHLYALNTPDNRLAIYATTDSGLSLLSEVRVGLEPVAVAVRETASGVTEAWVVNHLSDSVSVVHIPSDASHAYVARTLWVGDEPRDIVFAGPNRSRAFITTAHRGQNRPSDPQLTTPGIPRADVWVFDASAPGDSAGGDPLTIVELFGDTPRALAASADGKTVYAAVFTSGNQTTTLAQPLVSNNGGLPPPPPGATPDAPQVGLIVKYNGNRWVDEIDRDWSAQVPFSLPDYDVFRIDALANPPVEQARISGVGTILYNMAVRPGDNRVFVTNTEALNHERFETQLNGRFAPNRITVISNDALEARVDINPHIDDVTPSGTASERAQTLATPMQLIFSPDGQHAYLAGFGSARIGVFDADALVAGRSERRIIPVGMGPSGLALDSNRDRLYVMNRIDHSISVVNRANSAQPTVTTVPLPYNPEPDFVRAGRRFLYDATYTSGHGDVSCHSCHLFGDLDNLAWDLGNPFGQVLDNPNERNPAANVAGGGAGPGGSNLTPFHPMKGPMTTQSLRGLANAGPMHWRGDKTGGLTIDGEIAVEGDPYDEHAAFMLFNAAFDGLQGRAERLTAEEMQQFTDFILSLRYPPNPIKALDDIPTEAQSAGAQLFVDNDLIPGEDNQACASCHVLPLTTNGAIARTAQVAGDQADFKIANLRNEYTKVGMFGAAAGTLHLGAIQGQALGLPLIDDNVGEQIRGFGYTHDGSISTIKLFLDHPQNLFSPLPNQNGLTIEEKKRNIEAYLLSLDTGLKPVVGQQLTISVSNRAQPDVARRLQLFLEQAERGNADLVVQGVWESTEHGALYQPGGQFVLDSEKSPVRTLNQLLEYTDAFPITFTAVPPGDGLRMALDRDLNGIWDADESDVANRSSEAPTANEQGGTFDLWMCLLLIGLGLQSSGRRRVGLC